MTYKLSARQLGLMGTIIGGSLAFGFSHAMAQTGAAPAEPSASAPAAPAEAAPAPTTGIPLGPLTFYGQVEGGVTVNPFRPSNGLNFGQLFTDKANQATLNQVLLGVGKPVDPKSKNFDWGFMVQAMYGSDARYTHFTGELDQTISDRYQIDVIEADVSLHVPNFITEGGLDVKVGQYPTPLGFEVIDPKGNPFYSHSYIFNFGIPLKETGLYATLHVNDVLDLWGGADSGTNTSLGAGDNNGAAAGLVGFGLNLMGGNLTILALSHFGPENPSRTVPNANSYFRYENDAYATLKISDALSTTTELNLIRDDAFRANAYGIAQYASYNLTDNLTLNGRAEFYRDETGFFVSAFKGNLDFINAEEGRPVQNVVSYYPHGLSLGELTLGVTYKPSLPPLNTVMIRPEIRWDHSFGTVNAFNAGSNSNSVTLATDIVLGF